MKTYLIKGEIKVKGELLLQAETEEEALAEAQRRYNECEWGFHQGMRDEEYTATAEEMQ